MDGPLSEMLPQIQVQLVKEIQATLTKEYEECLSRSLCELQRQSQEQYGEAMAVLAGESAQVSNEKVGRLQQELRRVEREYHETQRRQMQVAKERFVENNFETRVLQHPRLQEVHEELRRVAAQQAEERISGLQNRRAKEIFVQLESKEGRIRNERDAQIRDQVFAKSGLETLKAEIAAIKITIAAKKSQYNVKIHAVDKEIRGIKEGIAKIEKNKYQEEIRNMKDKIEKYYGGNGEKFRGQGSNEKYKNEKCKNQIEIEEDSLEELNMQQQQQYSSKIEDKQQSRRFAQEDDQYLSMDYVTSDSQQNNLEEYIIPQNNVKYEDIYFNKGGPIYKYDIKAKLRQRWNEDSFDAYLNKENKCSNFQVLYEQHLKRLNKGLRNRIHK